MPKQLYIFSKEKFKEFIDTPGCLTKSPDKFGRNLYDFSQYLIKVDNHYVPAEYLFYNDSGELKGEYEDDIKARFPEMGFDEEQNLYYLRFDGADFGGYDVAEFVWYFAKKEDIIKELEK